MKQPKYVAIVTIPMALLLILGYQNGGHDARAGEVYSGKVITSNDSQLRLNTTPCDNAQTIVTFHSPYRRIRTDHAACNGNQYDRVQVEQE